MRFWILIPLLVAMMLPLTGATVARADADYHTEQLPLSLTEEGESTGHPELRSGQVVATHANGNVFSVEQFMVNGASPMTEYGVLLTIREADCGGDVLLQLPVGTLITNVEGNGEARAVVTPEMIAALGLHDTTLGAQWTLTDGGIDAYETECTEVAMD